MNTKWIAVVTTLVVAGLVVGSCSNRPRQEVIYRPGASVSEARICDASGQTRTWDDDCDRVSGYYIHPQFGYGYYNPGFAPIIIDRSVSAGNLRPGQTYRFESPRVVPPSSQTTRGPALTPSPNTGRTSPQAAPRRSSGTNFQSPTSRPSSGTTARPSSSGRSGTSFSGGGKGSS